MSVEIRLTADRKGVECDWGVLDHTYVDFRGYGQPVVGSLLLAGRQWVDRMIRTGPTCWRGAWYDVEVHDDRTFLHAAAHGQRWTWELFDAHWWDQHIKTLVYIGRWPD